MNKALIIAAAAASVVALPALAEDSSKTYDPNAKTQTEGQMNPTAGEGVQPNQEPGAPTSNRSDKATPAPANQVDKAPTGETSDRTPEHHQK